MMTDLMINIFGFGLFGFGPGYFGSAIRFSVNMPTPRGEVWSSETRGIAAEIAIAADVVRTLIAREKRSISQVSFLIL